MSKVHINTHEYGPGQRLSYQEDILKNSPMVPNPVEYEDIDKEMFKFVNERLVIVDDDGNNVPTFTLFSTGKTTLILALFTVGTTTSLGITGSR